MRKYIDTFKFKSITTWEFKQFFMDNFDLPDSIDWNKMFYAPGMPLHVIDLNKTLCHKCEKVKEMILGNINLDKCFAKTLTPKQIVYLLQMLLSHPLSKCQLSQLQKLYGLDNAENCEIKFRWFRLCIKGKWEQILPPLFKWISEIGRIKYLVPIYKEFNDWEAERPAAVEHFLNNKFKLMDVTIMYIEKSFKLK